MIVLIALAGLSIWGTIVESKYDARTAQELVYHSTLMYFTIALLGINLLFVMLDRWPWKKRHIPFLLAHIGIIMMIIGSYITREWGVDGTMAFRIGQTRNWVSTSDTYLNLYYSKDGNLFLPQSLLSKKVNFFKNPPEVEPLVFEPKKDIKLKVTAYAPYALREEKVIESNDFSAGPAIRFVLQNQFTSVTDWVLNSGVNGGVKQFGPARVVLVEGKWMESQGNEIQLRPKGSGKTIEYRIYSKKHKMQSGLIRPGESFVTPWMQMNFRVLKYLAKGQSEILYKEIERPTDRSIDAIQVDLNGKNKWVGLNSFARFYNSDGSAYIVSYANNKLSVGLEMTLKEFRVGRYPGSGMAKSYESEVEVQGKTHLISMNEPLKMNGFTFYQSSFQENERGEPVLSILSVNYDPGRFLKYVGSILLVLGAIVLFYSKNRKRRWD